MPQIRHTATLLDEYGEDEHTIVAYAETPFGRDEWTELQRNEWALRSHDKWLDTVIKDGWDIVDG